MRTLLLKTRPDVHVLLIKGDGGIFDIRVDGRLKYTKAKTGRFPTDSEVVACLGELLTAACSGRALPSSSLGPLGPPSPSTPVWQQQTIKRAAP